MWNTLPKIKLRSPQVSYMKEVVELNPIVKKFKKTTEKVGFALSTLNKTFIDKNFMPKDMQLFTEPRWPRKVATTK